MSLYNIPASRVIRHFDVNGKYCPGVVGWNSATGSESAWNEFKRRLSGGSTPKEETAVELYRVRKSWVDAKSQIGAYKNLNYARAIANVNRGYKVYNTAGKCVYSPTGADTPFKVEVKIKDLNIRKGPGYKTYKAVGFCPVGIYTIVETKVAEGYTWGRLKSGAGWIALEYAKRL
jgi:N-acetylmuramoyl-L-alanine amidase CwlA